MDEENKGDAGASTGEEELDLDIDLDDNGDEKDWKSIAQKQAEIAKNQKIRAERAEAEAKKAKENPPKEDKTEKPEKKELSDKDDSISQNDVIAIVRANVPDEDIDYVKRYAKLENISVAEALKKSELSEILRVKQETRKTAEVANTGPARKGAEKVSDEVLLDKLQKGEVPEKGTPEAERIFWARRGGKR